MHNHQVAQIPTVENNQDSNLRVNKDKQPPTVSQIQNYLISYLAELLEIEPQEINIKIPFDRYSLDSSASIEMITRLEDWLGWELDPTTLYYYPTVDALAKHLGFAENESAKKA